MLKLIAVSHVIYKFQIIAPGVVIVHKTKHAMMTNAQNTVTPDPVRLELTTQFSPTFPNMHWFIAFEIPVQSNWDISLQADVEVTTPLCKLIELNFFKLSTYIIQYAQDNV